MSVWAYVQLDFQSCAQNAMRLIFQVFSCTFTFSPTHKYAMCALVCVCLCVCVFSGQPSLSALRISMLYVGLFVCVCARFQVNPHFQPYA